MVFDQLFGVGGSAEERARRRRRDSSILDFLSHRVSALKTNIGPGDRQRLDEYLNEIREIEDRTAD
jgi:hypothetical protein